MPGMNNHPTEQQPMQGPITAEQFGIDYLTEGHGIVSPTSPHQLWHHPEHPAVSLPGEVARAISLAAANRPVGRMAIYFA